MSKCLFDFGSFLSHIVHSVFCKDLETDIEPLRMDVLQLYCYSAARHEDYLEIQAAFCVEIPNI